MTDKIKLTKLTFNPEIRQVAETYMRIMAKHGHSFDPQVDVNRDPKAGMSGSEIKR